MVQNRRQERQRLAGNARAPAMAITANRSQQAERALAPQSPAYERHDQHHVHAARAPPDSLANDLLRGCEQIAAFLGYETRATYHGLSKGYIPAVKEGDVWVASKTRLRQHYQGDGAANV